MNIQKLRNFVVIGVCFVMSMTAQAQIKADFSVKYDKCGTQVVSFYDNSTGDIEEWIWNFGNGSNPISYNKKENRALTYAPGKYTVTLTVKKGSESNTVSHDIELFETPIANFSISDAFTGCTDTEFEFISEATSPAAIVSYSWSLGDGTGSSVANPKMKYTEEGKFTIGLTVKDANGCADTKTFTDTIRVTKPLNINIKATESESSSVVKTEGCESPFTTTFSSQISNGTAVDYFWNFGDGENSKDAVATHTYTTEGSFDVELSAMTYTGCTTTKKFNNFININTFTPNFTTSNALCEGTAVTFNGTSNSPMGTWKWTIDGEEMNGQSVSKTYATAGVYDVTLDATNAVGCEKIIEKQIKINTIPTVDFSADKTQGCESGFAPQFTANSASAVAWRWDFGDGKTSSEQNPKHQYDASQAYTISLKVTDANQCESIETKDNYIQITKPIALFEITSSDGENFCLGSTTTITDNSSSEFGLTNSSYSWKFDYDNAKETSHTTSGQNATIDFAESGEFPIELTITDNAGCQAIYKDTVKIGVKPTTPTIIAPDACYNKNGVKIEASSIESDAWVFEFGDGIDSTYYNDGTITLKHIYDEPGTYTIKLVSRNYHCPSEPLTQDITLKIPKSGFSYNPKALCFFPGEMTFDPSTSKGAESYLWNFGDGTEKIYVNQLSEGHYEWKKNSETGDVIVVDTLSNTPTHEYAVANNYMVTLITYAGECSDTLPMAINMSGIKAGFLSDFTEVCVGSPIQFSDTSKTATGSIISRRWVIGEDTISVAKGTYSHTFDSVGTFNVYLKVENSDGCMDSTNKKPRQIVVNPLPLFNEFSIDGHTTDIYGACENGSGHLVKNMYGVAVRDLAKNSKAEIVSYIWDFGDGSTETKDVIPGEAALVEHLYKKGVYNVKLTAIDTKGCKAVLSKPNAIEILKPVANFNIPSVICANDELKVTNTSSGAELYYNWNWGDETPSTDEVNPTHSYESVVKGDTNFVVTLDLYDKYKFIETCHISASKTINVRKPIANFIASDSIFTCPPADVNFINQSTGTNLAYSWELSDGNLPSTVVNAFAKYYKSGEYDVQLTVTDDNGCKNVLSKPKYIQISGPRGEFVVSQSTGCTYDTLTFIVQNVVGATNRSWIYGDGRFTETGLVDTATYCYSIGNYYYPSLVLEDDNGCEVTILGNKITIFGVELGFTTDSILCEPTDLVINNTSIPTPTDVDDWQWIFSSGDTLTTQDAVPHLDYGIFDLSLIANIGGCTYRLDTTSFTKVLRTLDVNFTTEQNPAKAMETVVFTNTTDTAYGLPVVTVWDFDNGRGSTDFNTEFSFNQPGTYDITLMSYIHEECPNSYTLPLEVIKEYLIPNVFTPNGDGINDVFMEGDGMDEINLIIINRWGQKIYEGKGSWDGTCNGEEMSAGTYYYMITLPNGEEFQGPLMLIRN